MPRWTVLILLCAATPAVAGDLPQRGTSTVERLEAGPGLAVERVAQLRMRGKGLRFVDSEAGQFDSLTLAAGDCRVTLEDRTRNGRYETVTVREGGVPVPGCETVEDTSASKHLEAGEEIAALSNCRFHIRADYTVACQPTRFGRDNGEAWTVLSGFTDTHMRQATGEPSDLAWDRGLLVLDDISGVVYRVVETDFEEMAAQPRKAPLYQQDLPRPPSLTRTSQIGNLPVTAERQKVIDDQEATFSKYRNTPDDAEPRKPGLIDSLRGKTDR